MKKSTPIRCEQMVVDCTELSRFLYIRQSCNQNHLNDEYEHTIEMMGFCSLHLFIIRSRIHALIAENFLIEVRTNCIFGTNID
jgi:hypothetical protein